MGEQLHPTPYAQVNAVLHDFLASIQAVPGHERGNKQMNMALWAVQGLLALVFLLVGGMKAFLPLTTVKKTMRSLHDVPAALVRCIGVSELLGAIGLIVPTVTGIQPWLTVAAAVGLVVVMTSAAVFHASRREYPNIGTNVVLVLLAAFVVLGRWKLAPL